MLKVSYYIIIILNKNLKNYSQKSSAIRDRHIAVIKTLLSSTQDHLEKLQEQN